MSTFNLRSLRSSGSAQRIQTTDKEHDIAHEALLVAIMTYLSKADGSSKSLIDLRQMVENIIGNSHQNSTKIALSLINEAAENTQK